MPRTIHTVSKDKKKNDASKLTEKIFSDSLLPTDGKESFRRLLNGNQIIQNGVICEAKYGSGRC